MGPTVGLTLGHWAQRCSNLKIMRFTKINVVSESKKATSTTLASAEEELRGAAKATVSAIGVLQGYDALMTPVAKQIKAKQTPEANLADALSKADLAVDAELDVQALRKEILRLDATAAIQRIRKGHLELTRHGNLRTAFLTEYWNANGRKVEHAPGQFLLPDIGTKAVACFRFVMLLALSNQVMEK